jgi:hypothetical protein
MGGTELLIAGSLIQGFTQFQAAGAEADAAQQAADFKTRQLENQVERERAQAAIEARNREERLRQNLAAQRAAFGSAGVDINSGTAQTLQNASVSSINREQGQADFVSDQNILNLNLEAEQTQIGNVATQNALKYKQVGALSDAATSTYKIAKAESLIS